MNEEAFAKRRDEDWVRLKHLIDRASTKGVKKLNDAELREVFELYRKVSADLALVRTRARNVALVDFLNDLVARSYAVLYRAPAKPFFSTILGAIALAPQAVRRQRWFVATSVGITVFSALFIYWFIAVIPGGRDVVVSPQMEPLFQEWKKGQFQQHTTSESMMMNAMYASHNPQVAILAGSIGAGTFGIGSVALLFQNGAILGALSYDMNSVGKLGFLFASILPHGVTELSGAIIGGSAGLLLGWALINPGQRRRGDSLKAVGKDALILLLTSIVLMLMAAPIESYFSFNPIIPIQLKVMVALITFIAWMCFWTYFGREKLADVGSA